MGGTVSDMRPAATHRDTHIRQGVLKHSSGRCHAGLTAPPAPQNPQPAPGRHPSAITAGYHQPPAVNTAGQYVLRMVPGAGQTAPDRRPVHVRG